MDGWLKFVIGLVLSPRKHFATAGHYLAKNHPTLWQIRLHLFLPFVLTISLASTALGFLLPVRYDFVPDCELYLASIAIICLTFSGYWLYSISRIPKSIHMAPLANEPTMFVLMPLFTIVLLTSTITSEILAQRVRSHLLYTPSKAQEVLHEVEFLEHVFREVMGDARGDGLDYVMSEAGNRSSNAKADFEKAGYGIEGGKLTHPTLTPERRVRAYNHDIICSVAKWAAKLYESSFTYEFGPGKSVEGQESTGYDKFTGETRISKDQSYVVGASEQFILQYNSIIMPWRDAIVYEVRFDRGALSRSNLRSNQFDGDSAPRPRARDLTPSPCVSSKQYDSVSKYVNVEQYLAVLQQMIIKLLQKYHVGSDHLSTEATAHVRNFVDMAALILLPLCNVGDQIRDCKSRRAHLEHLRKLYLDGVIHYNASRLRYITKKIYTLSDNEEIVKSNVNISDLLGNAAGWSGLLGKAAKWTRISRSYSEFNRLMYLGHHSDNIMFIVGMIFFTIGCFRILRLMELSSVIILGLPLALIFFMFSSTVETSLWPTKVMVILASVTIGGTLHWRSSAILRAIGYLTLILTLIYLFAFLMDPLQLIRLLEGNVNDASTYRTDILSPMLLMALISCAFASAVFEAIAGAVAVVSKKPR